MMLFVKKYILFIAFAQAFIATFFSLYFSEILHFPPCILCWYQRIFMYPLVFVLLTGIFLKDKKVYLYALPLSIFGLFISSYHILLQQGIITESIAPCILGVSCTTKYIAFFGFITIPLLSFLSFLVITGSLLLYRNAYKK